MPAIVKYHRDCKADMREFVIAVPGREKERRELLAVFSAEILGSLSASNGDPFKLKMIGASLVEGLVPPTYHWPYSEMLVQFAVRFQSRRRWYSRCLPEWLAKLVTPLDCKITILRLRP